MADPLPQPINRILSSPNCSQVANIARPSLQTVVTMDRGSDSYGSAESSHSDSDCRGVGDGALCRLSGCLVFQLCSDRRPERTRNSSASPPPASMCPACFSSTAEQLQPPFECRSCKLMTSMMLSSPNCCQMTSISLSSPGCHWATTMTIKLSS